MAALCNIEREQVFALTKGILQILKTPGCIQRSAHTYAPLFAKTPRQFSIDDEFVEWQDISGTRCDEHEVDKHKSIVFEEVIQIDFSKTHVNLIC